MLSIQTSTITKIIKYSIRKPPFGGKKDGSWMIRDEVIAFAEAVRERN
jgi:hypothetical protein